MMKPLPAWRRKLKRHEQSDHQQAKTMRCRRVRLCTVCSTGVDSRDHFSKKEACQTNFLFKLPFSRMMKLPPAWRKHPTGPYILSRKNIHLICDKWPRLRMPTPEVSCKCPLRGQKAWTVEEIESCNKFQCREKKQEDHSYSKFWVSRALAYLFRIMMKFTNSYN